MKIKHTIIIYKEEELTCDICGKTSKDVKEYAVTRMCPKCYEDYFKEGMDYSDLTEILERRGIGWVSTKSMEYLTKKNI